MSNLFFATHDYTLKDVLMARKLKRNILISVGVIILIGVVTCYLLWNKPHRDVKDADATEINAFDLYNIFIKDSSKANLNYLNKIVKVSGTVSSVSVNQKKQNIILLKTTTDGAFVNCTMEENDNKYKEGDSVKLKGICAGYIPGDTDMGLQGDVFITRCYSSK